MSVLREEIEQLLLGPFAGFAVVVRSSASDEDAAFARAPGIYDSFLNRRTVDDVVESIDLCMAAIHSEEAHSYRAMMDLSLEASMNVIVQKMVMPEIAGVLNTRSPIGPRGSMLVEWTTGLGTAVVSGEGPAKLWNLPRSGAIDDLIPCGPALRDVGIMLERHFGRPQEIEWGFADGEVFVFQSRDSVATNSSLTDGPRFPGRPCQPLSPGYAVVGAGNLFGTVGVFEYPPRASELHADGELSAIVVRNGGPSSHSASMCRELLIPAVRDNGQVLPDVVYALDATHGVISLFDALPVSVRKQVVFAAAKTAARIGVKGWTAVSKYEAVLFDPIDQDEFFARVLVNRPSSIVRQRIVPFDDPARTYTGVSARLQITDGDLRLQLKRAIPLPDRPMRFDEEVHLTGVDEGVVTASLAALGYVPFPEQERMIERWEFDGFTVFRNSWPGAQHQYIGIEADAEASILSLFRHIGMDDSVLAGLDGKDLFELLGVTLNGAMFQEVNDVV